MSTVKMIVCCTCVALLYNGCKTKINKSPDRLGEISFTPTGKAGAQPAFKKGLLLLHSFEYVDAAEEFQNAKKIDPDFVMAYWGEAMAHNHPLWSEQDTPAAREVLAKIKETAKLSSREKAYLKAGRLL